MGSNRGKQVDRLVDLILRVQAGQPVPSLVVLAEQHGVCPRTIRRDLEAIELRLRVVREAA